MDEDIERTASGRFAPGQSGNPRGRKMQFKRDPSLPASRRRIIMAVADRLIDVKIDGKTEKMSLFEANVLALARAGATKSRIAASSFLDLAMETSQRDLEHRLLSRKLIERMNAVEETNEILRDKLGHRASGVVHVQVDDLNNWDPHRRLDDEWGVTAAMNEITGQPEAED